MKCYQEVACPNCRCSHIMKSGSQQGTALAQIKAKNYQQKYLSAEKSIYLIGMEFDKQQRNLVFFATERV